MDFEDGLLYDHPFKLKIIRKNVRTTRKMLSMDHSCMNLEEKLNMRFENPSSFDSTLDAQPGGILIGGRTSPTKECMDKTTSTHH